jgi:hypothetical protein
MKEEKQTIKKEVFIIHHLQNTQEHGFLSKILTYKSINHSPNIIIFSLL